MAMVSAMAMAMAMCGFHAVKAPKTHHARTRVTI
jgi:hypothetical protein